MSIFLCYVETPHLPSLLSHSLVTRHNFPIDQNSKLFFSLHILTQFYEILSGGLHLL